MRYKDWGAGALLDGERKTQEIITKELPDNLNSMAEKTGQALSEMIPKQIPGGTISILNQSWWSSREIATHMFPANVPGVLIDDKNTKFAGLEAGDYNEAALVVIFCSNNEANGAVWRRSEDLRGYDLTQELINERRGWIFRIN